MRDESSINDKAARTRIYKLINWSVHADKLEKYFKTVRAEAARVGYFENLYVLREDTEKQIQLSAGQHPIGSIDVKNDASRRTSGKRLLVEHGAALVVSQSVLGSVAIILYPYASEKLKQSQNYIIWRVLDDPTQLTDALIKAATRDFFRYIRVSSALFSESWLDRVMIQYLALRGQKYVKHGSNVMRTIFSHWTWILIGAAGSIASIYALWK